MITAVDTSVLLDVFAADQAFGPLSREALRRCTAEGRLVACGIVWAEIAAAFFTAESARSAMERLGVELVACDKDVALAAGAAWKTYHKRGGNRQRVIADFVIGAHALQHADRLLTRDRGFYRVYFRGLRVLDPSAPATRAT